MHPALTRAVENAITYFLVIFVVTAAGLLKSVNLSDHAAVWTALSAAALAAIVGAAKELTGFTALSVKPRAKRAPPR
jgi:hypothetical protein